MSRRAKTIEQTLDEYISTAPRDALVRLQSEVSAALKYRVFGDEPEHYEPFAPRRTRKPKDAAQLPLAAKGAE